MSGEAGEGVGPSRFVQLASRFGCERALGEFDLRCAGTLAQREAGYCLSVVGVGRFPAEGIGQAGR
jgi:hypothetical protein